MTVQEAKDINEEKSGCSTIYVRWTYQDVLEYHKELIKRFEWDSEVQYIEETNIWYERIVTTYNKEKDVTNIIKEIFYDEEQLKLDSRVLNRVWISFEWKPTSTDTGFRKILESVTNS